jgi:hypothetical protein
MTQEDMKDYKGKKKENRKGQSQLSLKQNKPKSELLVAWKTILNLVLTDICPSLPLGTSQNRTRSQNAF